MGDGPGKKDRTYRERRCGIADNCGPYLGHMRSLSDVGAMEGRGDLPRSIVIKFKEWDGEELHVFGNSENFYDEQSM
jgi:hypothetical protein